MRHLHRINPSGLGPALTLKLMGSRLGNTDFPHYYKDTVENANHMAK